MRTEDFEGRLQSLETSRQSILMRLKTIEEELNLYRNQLAVPAAEPIYVVPPPILTTPVVDPIAPQQPETTNPRVAKYVLENSGKLPPAPPNSFTPVESFTAPNPLQTKIPTAEETEYKFGINGLLRGGAVVVLVGILYLVATLVSQGKITPPVQFAGEILACLAFIAVGISKRDEREDFGQLMVGIGSFGLYASFAGGYAFKHLYEGEPLVAMYMVLSLANLGFSSWRSSKSFLTIGLLGGLVAAMMPMHKGNVQLDFALHFLILAPCATIIIRNKWNGMAGLMWAVSTAALIPATTSHFDQAYRVGATYLNCAIALYACGKVFKPSAFDSHAAIQTVMLVLTGFFAIGIDTGHKGSLHSIALTLISAAIGYALKENEKARNATWLGGLIVAAIITPIGFTQGIASFSYALEALALVLLAIRFQLVALWAVGFATFLFSLVAYLYFPDKNILSFARFSPPLELTLLAILSTTVVLNVRLALQKASKDVQDIALFAGASLLVAFFIRALNIALGRGTTILQTEDIGTLGIGLCSLILTLVAVVHRRLGLLIACLLLVLWAAALALITDPVWNPHWMSPVMIFFAASSVAIGGRYLAEVQEKADREITMVAVGLALSAFFVRALHLAGINHLLGFSEETVSYFAFGLLNIVWTAYAVKKTRPAYLWLAWISFIFVAIAGIALSHGTTPDWLGPFLLAIPLVSLCFLYVVTSRDKPEDSAVVTVTVFPGWILATVFFRQELMRPWIGMKEVAAYTVSWVIFAVFLITVGFKLDRRYLRYWAIAVFAVTVGKVFLVDLSALDSVIRVAMLTLLGLGMMGAGYWYILWKRGRQSAVPEEQKS